mmetsp:Transcript_773/g.3511  ORF Transcript_773/g.3511 Transcript_773/m.3511 type:complete len:228 (+) Transcript_773:256-939(+)
MQIESKEPRPMTHPVLHRVVRSFVSPSSYPCRHLSTSVSSTSVVHAVDEVAADLHLLTLLREKRLDHVADTHHPLHHRPRAPVLRSGHDARDVPDATLRHDLHRREHGSVGGGADQPRAVVRGKVRHDVGDFDGWIHTGGRCQWWSVGEYLGGNWVIDDARETVNAGRLSSALTFGVGGDCSAGDGSEVVALGDDAAHRARLRGRAELRLGDDLVPVRVQHRPVHHQ